MNSEERIIGFDEEVEASSYVALEEGLYRFTYCGYTQGNTNPRYGGESFPTVIAKLKAMSVADGLEVETEETFIMTTKWQWKLGQFWKSLGAEERQTPDGRKKVPQGWKSMVGRKGYFEVVKVKSKDGTKTYTNKNFIEPSKVQDTQEKWAKKAQEPAKAWSQGWK